MIRGPGPLTHRQQLETGLLIALAFLFFAYKYARWDLALIAGVLVFVALIAPIIFYPVAYLWFGLARILAYMTSNLFLILLYFILLTPAGLIRKWMGRDGLQLKDFKKSRDSVLRIRKGIVPAGEITNPF